jgi:hypothetical protein
MSTGLNEIARGVAPEHGPPAAATNGHGPDEAATNGHGPASPSTAPGDAQVVRRSRFRTLFRPLTRGATSAERRSATLTRDEATAWSSWEDLRHELDRSRRYGRCFTIVRVACPRPQARGRGELGRRRQTELADERVRVLSSLVRGIDRVWAHGENLYVLLPECDREMAEAMISRTRQPLSELVQGEAISLACFPEDGVASGALLAALYGLPVRERPALHAAEGGELPGGTAA